MSEPLQRLLSIMRRLRDPETGCEWDRAQDFATIAPYTIEEAYEVFDAIERSDMDDLRGELGDLLLQVVFHSQMAAEVGAFDFDAVATGIADKMEARHPHIFGDQSGTMDERRWEDLKATERAEAGQSSAMDGVTLALPALMRATKLQKRAARDGFDWPDATGAREKIEEELAEFEASTHVTDKLEEAGDLLFAVVNYLRKSGIDSEEALRAANGKFERRYRAMESLDPKMAGRSLDEKERLWQLVKRSERS